MSKRIITDERSKDQKLCEDCGEPVSLDLTLLQFGYVLCPSCEEDAINDDLKEKMQHEAQEDVYDQADEEEIDPEEDFR
jgi:uncharacterized Zn finger protein (UPF0148 family)